MSLGFEQAGFDVVCAVETDAAHAAAHSFNFPLAEVVTVDARALTRERLLEAIDSGLVRHGHEAGTDVDVVFGGPPCQGFSVGGLGDPNDPRNRLVEEFARLVCALRPRAWVLENVPAMATRSLPGASSEPVVAWLESRMRREGYKVVAAGVLNANRYGVPQDRRRLLLIGTQDGVQVELPKPTSAGRGRLPGRNPRPGERGHRDTPDELPECPTVADAIGDLPDIAKYDALWASDIVALSTDDRSLMRSRASVYAQVLAGFRPDPSDFAWPRRRAPSKLSASMRTAHGDAVLARFAATPPGDREPISRFLRLHADGAAPTLRAGTAPDRGSYSAPRPIHHVHNRVITVREAARLHGFPDWFRPTAAKWHGFRQVGNAVPPPLGRAVARELIIALGHDPKRPETRLELGRPQLLRVAAGGGRSAAKRLMLASSAGALSKAA